MFRTLIQKFNSLAGKPRQRNRRITLERLEDRIVLDAAIAASIDDQQQLNSHTTSVTAEAGAKTVEQSALAQNAPTQAASLATDAHADPLSQIYSHDLSKLLATNGADVINGATTTASGHDAVHVLVVSSAVQSSDQLLQAAGDGVLTVLYDAKTDSPDNILAKIKTTLAGHKADSIAFAAHDQGTGQFLLTGDYTVSSNSLLGSVELQYFWQGVGSLINDNGRIDLLACSLTVNDTGNLLLSQLETLTGKNFAASNDATGNPQYGGDWVLESDNVDLVSAYFAETDLINFSGLLAANQQPTATPLLTQTITYKEGVTPQNIGDIVVTDSDYQEQISASLKLQDTKTGSLTATSKNGETYNATTGEWSVTGTVSKVNAALKALQFKPLTNNDVSTNITVNIQDGLEDGASPLTGLINLNVTPVNDAPTATNLTQTIAYKEGAAALGLSKSIVVTDVDTNEEITAILKLSNPAVGTLFDTLGKGTYDTGSGTYTLIGSVSDVNSALAGLKFEPRVNNDLDATVSVTIKDGLEDGAKALAGKITLDVTPVNDPPVVNSFMNQNLSYTEGDTTVALRDIVVSDPDSGATNTVKLTLKDPTTGTLTALSKNGETYNSKTGVWTITGTLSKVNSALAAVEFKPAKDNDLNTWIETAIRMPDQAGKQVWQTGRIDLQVTPVNDQTTATNLVQTIKYTEDPKSPVALNDIVVKDVDTSEQITATLTLRNPAIGSLTATSGNGEIYTADSGLWSVTGSVKQVNTALAAVSFKPVANNDVDTAIDVKITDGLEDGTLLVTGVITLDVTPVNDKPSALTLSDNVVNTDLPPGITVGSLTTTDSDISDTFKYSLVSGHGSTDNKFFSIDGSTLKTTSSFNYKTKSAYAVRVQTTDLAKASYQKEIIINIKNLWSSGSGDYAGWDTYLYGAGSYFTKDHVTVWQSDTDPISIIKDINPGVQPSGVSNLVNIKGTIYFTATDGVNGTELWKSNGTPTGTVVIKDINPGSWGSDPYLLTDVNGVLFFVANDGSHGNELWKSDGTSGGTVMVKDITLGSMSSDPRNLTCFNGMFVFTADDYFDGKRELWKSDGTAVGTVLVKGPDSGVSVNMDSSGPLTGVKGSLFFAANDSTNSNELWKTDGTTDGTVLVKTIPHSGLSSLTELTNSNGTLFFTSEFFSVEHGNTGRELWKSDGTEAGTVMVKDINSGSGSSFLSFLTNVNGTLFFSAYDYTHGTELWKSDGTENGTVIVKDIVSGANGSNPGRFVNVNGILAFTATDVEHGSELWLSNGTEEGTFVVKDVNPGPNTGIDVTGSNPLAYLNGYVYFWANDGFYGRELWRSNGTESGTEMVKDFNPGFSDGFLPGFSPALNPDASLFVDRDGILYFSANDGAHGGELWRMGKSWNYCQGSTLVQTDVLGNAPYDGGSGAPRTWFLETDTSSPYQGFYVRIDTDATYYSLNYNAPDSSGWKMTKTGNWYYYDGQSLTPVSHFLDTPTQSSWSSGVDGEGYHTLKKSTLTDFTKDYIHIWRHDASLDTLIPGIPEYGIADTYSDANSWTYNNGKAWVKTDGLGHVPYVGGYGPVGEWFYEKDGVYKNYEVFIGAGLTRFSLNLDAPDSSYWQRTDDGAWSHYDGVSLKKVAGLGLVEPYMEWYQGTGDYAGYDVYNDSSGTKYTKDHKMFWMNGANGAWSYGDGKVWAGTTGLGIARYDGGFGPLGEWFHETAGIYGGYDVYIDKGFSKYSTDYDAQGATYWKRTDAGAWSYWDGTSVFNVKSFGSTDPFKQWYQGKGTYAGYEVYNDTNWTDYTQNHKTSWRQTSASDVWSYYDGAKWHYVSSLGSLDFMMEWIAGKGAYLGYEVYNYTDGAYYTRDHKAFWRHTSDGWSYDTGSGWLPVLNIGTAGVGETESVVLVKDIYPGGSNVWPSHNGSSPKEFVEMNGHVFFIAEDGTHGLELWKSDGTADGTRMVKDINPNAGKGVTIGPLINIKGILYFAADDGLHGQTLWRSDGTETGTYMVRISDAPTLPTFDGSNYFADVDGTLYFVASNSSNGQELWRSDGTETGTYMVKDINPGVSDSAPSYLTNVNGTLFFSANRSMYYPYSEELWMSDGTTSGTTLVKVFSFIGYGVDMFAGSGGVLYFAASDTSGSGLWRTDGTIDGTYLLVNGVPLNTNPSHSWGYGSGLTAIEDNVYFCRSDGSGGADLWKTDGTVSGTVKVKHVCDDLYDGGPTFLTNFNGALYFATATGSFSNLDYGLWKSDGTETGTKAIKRLPEGFGIMPINYSKMNAQITPVGNTMYFVARDSGQDVVWKSDGTEAGTVKLSDPLELYHSPDWLTTVGGKLYFTASVGTDGPELWTTHIDTTEIWSSPNQAPVNHAPGSQTMPEDSQLVFSAGNQNRIFLTDPDAGTNLLRVQITADGWGTLTLSQTCGLNFRVGDGTEDLSMDFSGSLNDINSALNGLVYSPIYNVNGVRNIKIVTNDLGNTGTGGPLSDTDSVTILVQEVNDPPRVFDLSVSGVEGSPVYITEWSFYDQDDYCWGGSSPDNPMYVTIKTLPEHGTLYNGNEAITSMGYKIPWDQALSKVSFISSDPDWYGVTSFSYTVTEDKGGLESLPATVTVSVRNVFDPAVLQAPSSFCVDEGIGVNLRDSISIVDPDGSTEYTKLRASVSHGIVALGGDTSGLTWLYGNNATKSFTVSGTLSDINSALKVFVYCPDNNFVGNDFVQVIVDQYTNSQTVDDYQRIMVDVKGAILQKSYNGANYYFVHNENDQWIFGPNINDIGSMSTLVHGATYSWPGNNCFRDIGGNWVQGDSFVVKDLGDLAPVGSDFGLGLWQGIERKPLYTYSATFEEVPDWSIDHTKFTHVTLRQDSDNGGILLVPKQVDFYVKDIARARIDAAASGLNIVFWAAGSDPEKGDVSNWKHEALGFTSDTLIVFYDSRYYSLPQLAQDAKMICSYFSTPYFCDIGWSGKAEIAHLGIGQHGQVGQVGIGQTVIEDRPGGGERVSGNTKYWSINYPASIFGSVGFGQAVAASWNLSESLAQNAQVQLYECLVAGWNATDPDRSARLMLGNWANLLGGGQEKNITIYASTDLTLMSLKYNSDYDPNKLYFPEKIGETTYSVTQRWNYQNNLWGPGDWTLEVGVRWADWDLTDPKKPKYADGSLDPSMDPWGVMYSMLDSTMMNPTWRDLGPSTIRTEWPLKFIL